MAKKLEKLGIFITIDGCKLEIINGKRTDLIVEYVGVDLGLCQELTTIECQVVQENGGNKTRNFFYNNY